MLIVGAGGILGPVFCEAFARQGADLLMADVSPPEEDAARLAESYGVTASAVAMDLKHPHAVRRTVEELERSFGPVDVLHANAATKGGSLDDFFEEDETYDPTVWREIMSVNLDGLFFVAGAVGRRMAERGRGSIILTSSIYGLMSPDQRIYEGSHYLGRQIRSPAVYSASKAGVVGLTRHLAGLWANKNVRVNAVAPGGVRSGQNSVFEQNYSRRVPMGRMAEATEMTGAAVFLASDASSYVTGQVIAVDGGLSCW